VTVRVLTYILTPWIQHPSLSVVVTSLLAVCFLLHPFDGHISSLRRVGWVTWSVYVLGLGHCLLTAAMSSLDDKQRLSRISVSGPQDEV